jgi:hypothetical protein
MPKILSQSILWCFWTILAVGHADWLAAQNLDKATLLQGVGSIPLPGESDALCTTVTINALPEIILTAEIDPDNLDQSFQIIAVSSSRLGKGKVLVFSTPAYFRKPLVQEVEVQKLLTNCLQWGSSARRKRVQVWGGDEALTTFITQQARTKLVGTTAVLDPSADILFLSQELTDTATISRIEGFVRQGGTLLFGSPLPDLQKVKQQGLAETRFNQLLCKAGLLQTNYVAVRYPHRTFLSAGLVPSYLGIKNILKSIGTTVYQPPSPMQGGYIFTYTLERALAMNPVDSPISKHLRQATHYWPDSLLVPTGEKPVMMGVTGGASTYLVQHALLKNKLRDQPNPAYVAPAAATFPGAVPATAARISTALVLPVRVGKNGMRYPAPGSRLAHSTGLYVPAGEKAIIYLTANDSLRQLQAQVGVHSDDLINLPRFTREAFDLTRRFDLQRGRNEVYSPYGGLLLLNIPDTTSLLALRIKVQGAVQAPRFERGKTSLAEWQKTIRQYPAPWAELASDNISLTVPAARIRTLDDPEKLLAFWDAALNTVGKLAGLTTSRRHPERIIVDQQVAFGSMFTDTDRIVVPNDSTCGHMLDADFMWKNGS